MDFHNRNDSIIDEDIITPIEHSPEGSLGGDILEPDSPSEAIKRVLHRHQRGKERRNPHEKGKKARASKSVKSTMLPLKFKPEDGDLSLTKEDVKGIYAELQAISDKLREENRILQERERKLRERESMLSISQESLQTITDHHIRVKMAAIEERFKSEITQMDQALREKTKENKRLKENFETIKQANDVLKKEVEVLKVQNVKLTKSSNSLQARLANLQRKVEYEQKLRDSEMIKQQTDFKAEPTKDPVKIHKDPEEKENKQSSKTSKISSSHAVQIYTGTLSTLLDWVCEAHLRQAVTDLPTKPTDSYSTPTFITERTVKILPSLVDILRDNASNISVSLPCLQFIYWSLLHIDQMQNQTNVIMSTTTRRLGEEIYYPKGVKVSDVDKLVGPVTDKCKEGVFIGSSNKHIRFLSTLIILKTLSRADVLAHAFDILKTELKNDQTKELFLFYQATSIITSFMKPIHKTFASSAVDVLLQMSGDSPFQQGFLCTCSTEIWFRNAALLLRTPLPDVKILERLSIILQKLSKIKGNKRYFEVYTIVAIIQEMLLDAGNDNAFLTLNLKSILFNLNVLTKS